jgi:hypothetical protein
MNGLKFKCETHSMLKRIVHFTGHSQLQDDGTSADTLIVRVYGDCGIVNGLLHDYTCGWLQFECSSRTLANLYNLYACRGCITTTNISNNWGKLDLAASMSGPHHYLGHLDPHDYITVYIPYITDIGEYGLPIYTSYSISNDLKSTQIDRLDKPKIKSRIPDEMIYTLPSEQWKWISGKDMTSIIKRRYQVSASYPKKNINTATGALVADSLFLNPGILELGISEIRLHIINPDPETNGGMEYDFADFGAQLVQNSQPWQFRQSGIQAYKHAQHKLRLITYYYGARYVNDYLMKPRYVNGSGGCGLFIERHEFIKAITPLNPDCGGFIILGRELKTWTNRKIGLELIGIRIPFGWTLLVEPWAIHGDSNLIGLYSMAMTGNHEAIATVDTVFLKNHNNGANVRVIGISQFITDTQKTQITKFHLGPQKLLITSVQLSPEELQMMANKLKDEIKAGCSWIESWYYNPVILTKPVMNLR